MSKHRRTRLGFAVLLAFFGSRGRFPRFVVHRARQGVELLDKLPASRVDVSPD